MNNNHRKTNKNKQKFRLLNEAGLSVSFSNYGARITSIKWRDKEIARNGYISGRCANRIANASFVLNGQTYYLDKNEGNNHLHGGHLGFSKKYWEVKNMSNNSITFFLHSPDGDMGYPGNLDISVTYSLFQDGLLTIEYHAKSDEDTILNPTNHLFLDNANKVLFIDANSYTEKNTNNIPTGRIVPIEKTMYDFFKEKRLDSKASYDVNYVLKHTGYRKVASLKGQGVCVDLYTDRPGMQLYQSKKHLCLETQCFPDAIHHPSFPSSVLKKDAAFYSKTAYHFIFDKE